MAGSGIEFHRLWIEQCAAPQRIKERFGLGNTLEYLVGEKLMRFVDTAEHNPLFAQEVPSFVAEIKRVFSVAEVGNYAVTIARTKRLSLLPACGHSRNFIDIRANPLGCSRLGRISRRRPPLLYRLVLAR